MLKKNTQKILKLLSPQNIVLDIGGWSTPFNRANYVIDIMPYESRGIHGFSGPAKEWFSKKTWIIHDISSKKPLPFKNKEIDFIVCSQTLEDIRDPIYLCAEMIRVGKRGYIEVPSRILESIMGINGDNFTGYSHHRWLIDIAGNEIIFRFKTHLINSRWKYHLPKNYINKLTEKDKVSYLFWQDSFDYKEIIEISYLKVARELEAFIRKKQIYPKLYYLIDQLIYPRPILKKILLKYPRLEKISEKLFGDIIKIGMKGERIWLNTPQVHSR